MVHGKWHLQMGPLAPDRHGWGWDHLPFDHFIHISCMANINSSARAHAHARSAMLMLCDMIVLEFSIDRPTLADRPL
jgi:hypothetical protein